MKFNNFHFQLLYSFDFADRDDYFTLKLDKSLYSEYYANLYHHEMGCDEIFTCDNGLEVFVQTKTIVVQDVEFCP